MRKYNLLQEALQIQDRIIADRRFLHAHAETGFDLNATLDYVCRRLEETGLNPQKCGRCGVVCTLGRPGKTILLRADMDALPMQEESGLPFACESGSMHACGHDLHTAMLLGAAQLLKKHEAELSGTVKLMFQPAEELLLGARDMLESGILEDPRPDAAAMLHVMTGQPIPIGTLLIPPPGVSAPAAGTFTVHIQGKGAHGAMPHTGADPISAGAHMVIALQEINARELAPSDNAALTIGVFRAGSTANVIPDTALLRGSFRAFSDDTFQHIRRRIEEICCGTANLFRTEAKVSFNGSCPTLVNDEALCNDAAAFMMELLGSDRILDAAKMAAGPVSRSSGSEDFAAISHEIPSVMLALAAGHPKDGCIHPLHHPGAIFDERALPTGCAAYACIAMRWLEKHAAKE